MVLALPLLLLIAPVCGAAESPDAPSFVALSGGEPVPAMDPALLAAFRVLLPEPPAVEGPLRITAIRRQPTLSLPEAVAPRSIGEPPGPPEQAIFLLSVAQLAPTERLDPVTAGRLADRLYTEGRLALAEAVEARARGLEQCRIWGACPAPPLDLGEARSWMSAALPLYRQAAHGTVRRSERLALRLGWAALLGGGTADDLELIDCLLRGGVDDAWSAETRLVLGEALASPATWDHQLALDTLIQASRDPSLEQRAWASYALAWALFNVGETAEAIDTFKNAVFVAAKQPNPSPVIDAALKDLLYVFGELGEDPFQGHGPRDRALLQEAMRRLTLSYLENGRAESAIQLARRYRAEGFDPRPLIGPVLKAAPQLGPSYRLDLYDELLRPGWAADPDQQDQIWLEVAKAAAELHFSQYAHLRENGRQRASLAYQRSLEHLPPGPERDAVLTLLHDLEADG